MPGNLHVPQHPGNGPPPDEQAQKRAHQRGIEGVAEVMPPQLSVAVAQRLERAHLNALVFQHARNGGQHDHGGHGEGQKRKDVAEVAKHIYIHLDGLHGGLSVPADHQRLGIEGFQRFLDGLRVRLWREGEHGAVGRQERQAGGVEDYESVVERIGRGALGKGQVFRAQAKAAYGVGIRLAVHQKAQAVAGGKAVGLGEALVQEAAAQVAFQERPAALEERTVDAHGLLVALHQQRGLVGQIHRQFHAQPRLRVGHAANAAHPRERVAIHGAARDPQVGQVLLLKVGLRRCFQHAPAGVQPTKDPAAQGAEQNNRQKLQAVLPHVPKQLAAQGAPYHTISSMEAGRSLISTCSMRPLRTRMTRRAKGAMAALWVMMATVVW